LATYKSKYFKTGTVQSQLNSGDLDM